jgi:tetratricopeptide (TPR) repeat protein
MPFALLAGCAVASCTSAFPRARTLVIVTVLAVATVLGCLTFRQASYWHDSESLWRHTLAINPKNSMGTLNLAAALAERGSTQRDPLLRERDWNEAQRLLEGGLSRRDDPQMNANLALLCLMRMKQDPSLRIPLSAEALSRADHAIALGAEQGGVKPDWKVVRASALMASGRCPEAVDVLVELEHSAPWTPSLERTLSLALDCTGNKPEAYSHLQAALLVERDDADLRLRAGDLALALGSVEDARAHYQRALDLLAQQLGDAAGDDLRWQSARAALDRLH